MKFEKPDILVPGVASVIGVVLLAAWMFTGSPYALETRVPGLDQAPGDGDGNVPTSELVKPVAGTPVLGDGKPSELEGVWPGFRGSRRSGIVDDGVALARSWPSSGPSVLWSREVGDGYASPVVHQGRVYLLDYDDQAQADVMVCLSLDDGSEIWRNSYPVEVAWNHGYTRTMPLLVDDTVITLGPRCHVACWDAESGECRWLLDLVLEEGANVPRWYAGQCPLLDGEHLILAPGGSKTLVMAVDPKSGEAIWRSPNPRKWNMTHVSVVPMEVDGQRTYVYCGSGGVAGVSAEEGTWLWDTVEWPETFAHAPSPLVLPDNRVMLCSGYDPKVGTLFLKVKRDGDDWSVEVDSKLTPREFNSEQQTPILFQDHIIGIRKRGGGQLVCMDLQGKEVWNSGSERFGHGPYLIADGLVFALSDHGRLVMGEASTTGFEPLGSFEAFKEGHDAWGPMVPVAGRLILRDMTRIVCIDIAAH